MTLTEEAPTASLPSATSDARVLAAWPAVLAVAVLIALPLAVAVLRTAPRLAVSNTKVLGSKFAVTVPAGEERCQGGELLPAKGASFVVFVGLPDGGGGPALRVRFLDRAGGVVSTASTPGGYSDGRLRLPFSGPDRDEPHGTACFRNEGNARLLLAGNLTPIRPETAIGPNSPGSRTTTDEVRIDYYQAKKLPIWQLLPDVARRFSYFKPAFLGPWSMWAALAGVLALGITSVLFQLRFVRRPASERRLGRCVAACFALALAHGVLWSVVTPTLQTPDENVHYAYTAYVREFWKPPGADGRTLRGPNRDGTNALRHAIPFNVEGRPAWSDYDERALRRDLQDVQPPDPRSAGKAARGSPVYYYVTAATTKPLSFMDDLDRLFAVRVVSAALAALTAAITVLFLAEVFRRIDLGVVAGGLAVALHPVSGFLNGGVNNDNLLIPLSALAFYLLARGFRRGMTPLLATAIGVTLGVGYLTKPRMLFFVPVSMVAVLWLAWRRWRSPLRSVVPAGLAFTGFAVPAGGWRLVVNRMLEFRGVAPSTGRPRPMDSSWEHALSYTWQSFLPRLWFMEDAFTTWPRFVLWDVYAQGFVGRFGWFQYDFPDWVEIVGGVLLAVLVSMAVTTLWRSRPALRGRGFELLTYVGLLVSTAALMGVASYRYRYRWGFNLEQTRYLFPCLVLYGGVVALAVRSVATRFRPALAAALVTVFGGHVLASVLLSIHRYYV
jgi:hypothetical protein